MLVQIVKNGFLQTSDVALALLMITDHVEYNNFNGNNKGNLSDLTDVIGIFLNSKNEKIIKSAFLLTTLVFEILEKSLDNTFVCK